MSRVEWHGDEALAHVRRRAVQFITRACITVTRKAKELLSVAGTGVLARGNRRAVKEYNEAHKLAIQMGAMKKLRVTKAGHITSRRKARKHYWHNVGGKRVRAPRPPKPPRA